MDSYDASKLLSKENKKWILDRFRQQNNKSID